MKGVTRVMLTVLPLFLTGLRAYVAAAEAATCLTPGKPLDAITRTHTSIPYPSISQRLGEHGTTRVAVNIGTDGVPIDVTVSQSSGTKRLDDATVAYIKGHYRWQPPPEGCEPTPAQTTIIVAWHLDPFVGDLTKTMSEADYPPGAVGRAEEGDTTLELSLGDGGIVKDGRMVSSSGYPDLDDKALAVMKITPGILSGKPAGTEFVYIRWTLPAWAQAAQKSKGVEIVEIHAPRVRVVE